MLTPYGYDNAFLMLGVGIALLLLAATLPLTILVVLAAVLGVLITAFTLWFFRDPVRALHPDALRDASLVVSPADGTVTEVFAIENSTALHGAATQITIFLSPLDVHVNRYPASGTIVDAQYISGKYLMAFNPKSSEANERSEFVLRTAFGDILYKQITGFLARRIVYDTKRGDVVRAGERFGMMKFGSRMDIIVPASAEIFVKVGQKVTGAHTILAKLNLAVPIGTTDPTFSVDL
ncbi:MAG: phosphatidylserine decarboxylase [bacterium]|nr:phosphatidylserine decarboxylase [bacterium]